MSRFLGFVCGILVAGWLVSRLFEVGEWTLLWQTLEYHAQAGHTLAQQRLEPSQIPGGDERRLVDDDRASATPVPVRMSEWVRALLPVLRAERQAAVVDGLTSGRKGSTDTEDKAPLLASPAPSVVAAGPAPMAIDKSVSAPEIQGEVILPRAVSPAARSAPLRRWYPLWRSFYSEVSARGFARHMEGILTQPLRIVAIGKGEFMVEIGVGSVDELTQARQKMLATTGLSTQETR